jgi:putative CocE/NonD family hydrolase
MNVHQAGTGARKFKMIVESDVYATMRDGVRLAARIYRPEGQKSCPTLLAVSPYMYVTDDLPHSSLFLWREVGPVQWYVEEHGYAYVHVDVRGSGKSEGVYNLLDRVEQQDMYELVEWAASQPWSNGRVGGIGQSYYAWTQWFMGIVNPPSLKCIVPYDGCVDLYRDIGYHGGIYCDFMPWWYQMLRVNNLQRIAGGQSGKAMPHDLAGEMAMRRTRDEWWAERSAFERLSEIKVPVLSIGHWGKIGLHLRGNIIAYEKVQGPKKLVVTGARDVFEAHELFDQIDYHERELLPFYDCHLKGVDNGVMDGAPVRLFVRGLGAYREEEEWPLKRANYISYYLNGNPSGSLTSINDGGLSTEKPDGRGGTTEFTYPDPQWRIGGVTFGPDGPDTLRRTITFTTPPLEEDVEVTGPIVLELFAASSNTDTEFFVRLADQSPQSDEDRRKGRQPASVNISKGWLRASHREKDAALSTAQRPFYTHRQLQPIEPGRVYKFDIEIIPCANVFKKGHRIRLELTNADSPITDSLFTHQYAWQKVGTDAFHHNDQYASRLLLPIVPAS